MDDVTGGAPSEPIAELEPETEAGASGRRRGGRRVVIGAVVLTALFAVIAVAVVAQPSDEKSALALLQDAPKATTGSGSARLTTVVEMTFDGDTEVFMQQEGLLDYDHQRSTITIRTGPIEQDMRTIGDVSYQRVSLPVLPDGKEWLAVTPDDLAALDIDVDETSLGSTDPAAGLEFFGAIEGDPELVGSEDLGGVEVEHYEFTIDLATFTHELGDAMEKFDVPGFGRGIAALEDYVDLAHIPGEAWIDDEGRIRRFDYTFEIEAEGEQLAMRSEMRFSHFGVKFSLEAPDAAETITLSEVPDYFKDLQRAAREEAEASFS
jgi:hypothetical protein